MTRTSLDRFIRGQVSAREQPGKSEKPLIDAHESELVRRILARAHLFPFFDFVVSHALGFPRSGWEYFFAEGVDRKHLGLEPGLLPGDVDVLIVPKRGNVLHVGKAAAVEVKRLALRDGKLGRNVDRYGVSQAHGLLRDGFPYVGILHIVVAQTNASSPRTQMESWRVLDDAGRIERIGPIYVDETGMKAAKLQIKRLLTRSCDPVIGLNSVALQIPTLDEEGMSVCDEPERAALPNPNASPELMRNIARYVAALSPTAACRD